MKHSPASAGPSAAAAPSDAALCCGWAAPGALRPRRTYPSYGNDTTKAIEINYFIDVAHSLHLLNRGCGLQSQGSIRPIYRGKIVVEISILQLYLQMYIQWNNCWEKFPRMRWSIGRWLCTHLEAVKCVNLLCDSIFWDPAYSMTLIILGKEVIGVQKSI